MSQEYQLHSEYNTPSETSPQQKPMCQHIINGEYYADCDNKTNPIPLCNTTINNEEYYDKNILKNVGNVISIPFLCSSMCLTLIFTIVFGLFFKTKYSQSQFSFSSIILLLLFLCCLSSCLKYTKEIYVAKRAISTSESLVRPCYSSKNSNIVN
jgi:hypothetical protein